MGRLYCQERLFLLVSLPAAKELAQIESKELQLLVAEVAAGSAGPDAPQDIVVLFSCWGTWLMTPSDRPTPPPTTHSSPCLSLLKAQTSHQVLLT